MLPRTESNVSPPRFCRRMRSRHPGETPIRSSVWFGSSAMFRLFWPLVGQFSVVEFGALNPRRAVGGSYSSRRAGFCRTLVPSVSRVDYIRVRARAVMCQPAAPSRVAIRPPVARIDVPSAAVGCRRFHRLISVGVFFPCALASSTRRLTTCQSSRFHWSSRCSIMRCCALL